MSQKQQHQALAGEIISIYQRCAQAWDHERSQHFADQIWLDRFLKLLPAQSNILDLGCGAAVPIAQHCIQHGHQVTGVDTSSAMLDIAKERFPQQHWYLGDMRDLNLHQRFAGIIAWDSFFHLMPDQQRAMFEVFQRHALPHAALLFTTGDAYGTAIGDMQGHALYHASLDPTEYRELLHQYGFVLRQMRSQDPECTGHTVWLAQMR